MTAPPNDETRSATNPSAEKALTDFIRTIIRDDLASGKHDRVATRFPPEPNGYLHIGHAKSICLNFGVAAEHGGTCNLRFDDTNPETEDMEYVESIQRDVRWLGFDWDDRLYFASDYFERLYRSAEQLIENGLAYVDSLSEEEIRDYRGTVTEPGRPSPWRERPAEENLDLFRRMRAGEFPDGAHVLRAKIDMASPNMKMRDPLLYRIRHADHYRAGDAWPIYPMYDFAHPLSDAFESITHSLCTLEFENNRDIYDWLVENVRGLPARPRQIEFARLNLSYTVMSKRKLLQLVEEGRVSGWDDPRMPTLSGLRRRGCTPSAIRTFCDHIGVAKSNSVVDVGQLEHVLRDELNWEAPRVLAVLRPLKVVIENFPEGETDLLEAPYWPHDIPKEGTRELPFTRELLIERDDFREDPPKRFHRLAPGREVRLRYAYFIRCEKVIKDVAGHITELRCTYDPTTRGGAAADGRKVAATLHWVSAAHAVPVEVRLYDRLFDHERPDAGPEDFRSHLNPHSLEVLEDSVAEPSVGTTEPGSRFQFERHGYFYLDPETPAAGRKVFNRIVSLRDSWAKVASAAEKKGPEESAAETKPASPKGSRPAPPPWKEKTRPAEEQARFEGYRDRLGVAEQAADALAADPALAAFFEAAVEAHGHAPAVANWVVHELLRELKSRPLAGLPFGGAELGELVALQEEGQLAGRAAKEVFAEMLEKGGSPRAIVERRGLERIADAAALEPVVDQVLASHPDEVAAYRAGKEALLGFFTGQVMKATRGAADARQVGELLRGKLRRE